MTICPRASETKDRCSLPAGGRGVGKRLPVRATCRQRHVQIARISLESGWALPEQQQIAVIQHLVAFQDYLVAKGCVQHVFDRRRSHKARRSNAAIAAERQPVEGGILALFAAASSSCTGATSLGSTTLPAS